MFLWGRGGVSTGAVRAVTAVTLAVQAQSDGEKGGGGAKVRGQPHTDTTHQARCEEMLTSRGGRTQDDRNSLCFWQTAFLNW